MQRSSMPMPHPQSMNSRPACSATGHCGYGAWSNTVHAPIAKWSIIRHEKSRCLPGRRNARRDAEVTFHSSSTVTSFVVTGTPAFDSRWRKCRGKGRPSGMTVARKCERILSFASVSKFSRRARRSSKTCSRVAGPELRDEHEVEVPGLVAETDQSGDALVVERAIAADQRPRFRTIVQRRPVTGLK